MRYGDDLIKDELIGAKVKRVFINQTEQKGYTLYDIDQLVLETDKGNFRFSVSGDCCSTGYIDHIGLPYFGFDHRDITEVVDIEMPEGIELASTNQESDVLYGTKIKLGGEYIFLEYRNSSNGYYGSYYDIDKIDSLDGYVELTTSF